jgi:hypothetical protein
MNLRWCELVRGTSKNNVVEAGLIEAMSLCGEIPNLRPFLEVWQIKVPDRFNDIGPEETRWKLPRMFRACDQKRPSPVRVGHAADQRQVLAAEILNHVDGCRIECLSYRIIGQWLADASGDGLGHAPFASSGESGEDNGSWGDRVVHLEQWKVFGEPCFQGAKAYEPF